MFRNRNPTRLVHGDEIARNILDDPTLDDPPTGPEDDHR